MLVSWTICYPRRYLSMSQVSRTFGGAYQAQTTRMIASRAAGELIAQTRVVLVFGSDLPCSSELFNGGPPTIDLSVINVGVGLEIAADVESGDNPFLPRYTCKITEHRFIS